MALNHVRDLYQQVILERYKKPHWRGKTQPIDRQQQGHNPACGDQLELTMRLAADRIVEVRFTGKACAIALAAADLMAEAVRDRTIDEALQLVQGFAALLQGQATFPPELDQLNVMQAVVLLPIRVKCANLPWQTLEAALMR